MQRKAGAGRPPPEIGAPTPVKILRHAVMQAGEAAAGLIIIAGTAGEDRVTLDTCVSDLPDHALMALIEGPEGRYGLMVLDGGTVAALIEVQTTGRVVPRPAVARAPTRTDAVLCADFIDRVLELLETRAAEAGLEIAPALTGYRYALTLAETRAILMTLPELAYRRFRLPLDLGRGAKQGALQIVLPFDIGRGDAPAGPSAGAGALPDGAVAGAPVRLSAVLHRLDLPLAAVAALTAGSRLPVPRSALAQVELRGIDGRLVGHGRLGMAGENRAIRIGGAPPEIEGAVALPFGQTPAPEVQDLAGPGAPDEGEELPDSPDLSDLSGLPESGGPLDLSDLPDLSDLEGVSDPADPLAEALAPEIAS